MARQIDCGWSARGLLLGGSVLLIVAGIAATPSLGGRAPQANYATAAARVVEPQAYVSLEPVPRGRDFEIAVVGKIAQGFHVNAHVPSEDYLIPTKVAPDLPAGITLTGATYPPGMMHKFQFAPSGLRVYENSFTVRLRLRVSATAALGPQRIPLTVAYQACNESACLPPTKVPASARFTIAAADAPAHPANPQIFSQPTPQPASRPAPGKNF